MCNRSTWVVLALSVAAIGPLPSWCQRESPPYCHRDALDTEVGNDAYAFRDGNRCEGTYRLKLSGGSTRFSLRSLTSARSSAVFADPRYLQVSWPSLPSGVKLRISVVPLDSPILYRMDTEADGAAGVFRWPAEIARRRFSSYLDLGVVAFYPRQGRKVHIACVLGPMPAVATPGLRADILSLEPISHLEIFSRSCRLETDCDSPESGPLVRSIPGRDRDGTFTLNIPPLTPADSDFFSLRFAGRAASLDRPPLAVSIILRAPPISPQFGSQR